MYTSVFTSGLHKACHRNGAPHQMLLDNSSLFFVSYFNKSVLDIVCIETCIDYFKGFFCGTFLHCVGDCISHSSYTIAYTDITFSCNMYIFNSCRCILLLNQCTFLIITGLVVAVHRWVCHKILNWDQYCCFFYTNRHP